MNTIKIQKKSQLSSPESERSDSPLIGSQRRDVIVWFPGRGSGRSTEDAIIVKGAVR